MLGIVLVVYRSFEDTVNYVTHELPKITCPYEAVIVDLASTPDSSQKLASHCGATVVQADRDARLTDDLFVLHTAENLGYAKGNNLGARFLLERFPGVQWLLFSNTDVELVTPGLAQGMISVLQSQPEAACVGPRVLSPDGSEQLPFSRPIPIETLMWHNVAFPFLRKEPPWEAEFKLRPGTSSGQYCYWVSGCFLMARAADFVAAGGFDEGTFLYCEEAILSERLQHLGKRFYYEPALVVRHHSGKTVSRYLQNPELASIDVASSLHYYRTYRGIGRLQRWLFRLCGAIRVTWVRLIATRNRLRQAGRRAP